MGKQTKAKKVENLGKGKVTPVQVAFIVDRYLSDNDYTQTRSIFRTEASTLISKTQVREAPKSLLSLGAILDEYICLKEQKVMLEQEKCRVDQEKCRVETLLQGMHNVMHAYNSSGSITPPSISATATKSMALAPQSDPTAGSPSGYSMNNTSASNSVPWPSKNTMEPTNFLTPADNFPSRNKRKGSRLVPDVPPNVKRPCSQVPTKLSPAAGSMIPLQALNTTGIKETVQRPCSVIRSTPHNHLPIGPSAQGSSVAKSLFKQPPLCPQTNSPSPKTPPQALTSQADKSVSPLDSSSLINSTGSNTPQEITPTNCPVISSKTVTVSPFKHVAYYSMERNHYISSSSPVKTNLKRLGKRDHVKGRLDFDASESPASLEKTTTADISTSGHNGELDIFDMDIPNFDVFGADFSLSELLVDIDLDYEGVGFPCQTALDSATDLTSGPPHESGDGSVEADQTFQTLSELSSTVTEVFCEKDMNIQGPDSLASMKSITKSIRILSPAKNGRRPSLGQENLSARD